MQHFLVCFETIGFYSIHSLYNGALSLDTVGMDMTPTLNTNTGPQEEKSSVWCLPKYLSAIIYFLQP